MKNTQKVISRIKQEEKTTQKAHQAEIGMLRGARKQRRNAPRAPVVHGPWARGTPQFKAQHPGKRRRKRSRRSSMPDLVDKTSAQLRNLPMPSAALTMQPHLSNDGLGMYPALGNTKSVIFPTGATIPDVVMNGVCKPGQDPRWGDRYGLTPTFWIEMTRTQQLHLINTSAAEGGYTFGTAGVVFGTNVHPAVSVSSIQSSTSSTAAGGMPLWNHYTAMDSCYASADFLARPCGQRFEIVFNLQGINHTVELNAFPTTPAIYTDLTDEIDGWPTDVRAGPTDLQKSWGAKTWHPSSGCEPISMCTLPMDTRSLDFAPFNVDRGNYLADAGQAWAGWCFWGSGFGASDVVRLTTITTWELKPITKVANMYVYPSSSVPYEPGKMEYATKILSAIKDMGGTAFQGAWDSVKEVLVRSVREGILSLNFSREQLNKLGFAEGVRSSLPHPNSFPATAPSRKASEPEEEKAVFVSGNDKAAGVRSTSGTTRPAQSRLSSSMS